MNKSSLTFSFHARPTFFGAAKVLSFSLVCRVASIPEISSGGSPRLGTNESRCMSQTKFANVCKSEMQNSFVHNMTVVICGYFVSFRPFTNSGFCAAASKVAANGS